VSPKRYVVAGIRRRRIRVASTATLAAKLP